MKRLRKIAGQIRRVFYAYAEWYRLQNFIWWSRALGMSVNVGARTCLQVPLGGGGRGTLRIGCGNVFGYRMAMKLGSGGIFLQPRSKESVIEIGTENLFNNNVTIVANKRISVGSNCQIGDLVAIYDSDFHELDPATRNRSPGKIMPVSIGNNVWLGSRVMVLKGVTIGDNSVIGAMSLVTKSIPANCIAAGNPAKVIRIIER